MKVVRKSYLCPHSARGYRVKLQRQEYTARRTTDNIYTRGMHCIVGASVSEGITTSVIGVANSGVNVGSGVSNRYANIIFWLSVVI